MLKCSTGPTFVAVAQPIISIMAVTFLQTLEQTIAHMTSEIWNKQISRSKMAAYK